MQSRGRCRRSSGSGGIGMHVYSRAGVVHALIASLKLAAWLAEHDAACQLTEWWEGVLAKRLESYGLYMLQVHHMIQQDFTITSNNLER